MKSKDLSKPTVLSVEDLINIAIEDLSTFDTEDEIRTFNLWYLEQNRNKGKYVIKLFRHLNKECTIYFDHYPDKLSEDDLTAFSIRVKSIINTFLPRIHNLNLEEALSLALDYYSRNGFKYTGEEDYIKNVRSYLFILGFTKDLDTSSIKRIKEDYNRIKSK